MTDKQILKKAIEKVIKNGYGKEDADAFLNCYNFSEAVYPALIILINLYFHIYC